MVNSEIRNVVNLKQKQGRNPLAGADKIEPGQSETDGIDIDQRVGTKSRSANTCRRTSLGRINKRTTVPTNATHVSQGEEGWLTDTEDRVLIFRLLSSAGADFFWLPRVECVVYIFSRATYEHITSSPFSERF